VIQVQAVAAAPRDWEVPKHQVGQKVLFRMGTNADQEIPGDGLGGGSIHEVPGKIQRINIAQENKRAVQGSNSMWNLRAPQAAQIRGQVLGYDIVMECAEPTDCGCSCDNGGNIKESMQDRPGAGKEEVGILRRLDDEEYETLVKKANWRQNRQRLFCWIFWTGVVIGLIVFVARGMNNDKTNDN
jgi:hypothetical protein